jgi:invasion protein IalB
MKTSRLTALIATAAVSVGTLAALVAPASIAQAQPKETFMCWNGQTPYEPGTKIPIHGGSTLMCQKDGTWKNIGPNHN